MSARNILMSASGSTGDKLYVDDVFSAYTYTGNGSTQTINNGIDLLGKGGMVLVKCRNAASGHVNFLNQNGTESLQTNNANGLIDSSAMFSTSTGFSLSGAAAEVNQAGQSYVAWVLRNAPKFFTRSIFVDKSAGSNTTVDISSLGTVGMVRVKSIFSTGSWYIWHRSLATGQLLIGETTAAAATLGHITVSGTTLTLVNGVIADGPYLVEGFAHDTSADGIIQCGSFTTDGSGNATVNLGWEPQYLLDKRSGVVSNWGLFDVSRGMPVGGASPELKSNTSDAETTSGVGSFSPTATGFTLTNSAASQAHIYLAIRRPNKPPTTGTQVYNAIARTGTGAAATVTGVGFAPDLSCIKRRTHGTDHNWTDRLRGADRKLSSDLSNAESGPWNQVKSFDMDGITLGIDDTFNEVNIPYAGTYINHFFKRAPGVFDEVCYTGTGVAKTEAHGLGVVPELMIVKGRSVAASWLVFTTPIGLQYLILNATSGRAGPNAGAWTDYPTATGFHIGYDASVNGSANTYVAYLFATKAGVSKVFSFTGNGGTQTIDCGFTTGARFVMIKATSTTGDWLIGDSTRGLVAGNDPRLSLNTTAAEVTTEDWLDPHSSGFVVNQVAGSSANASGVSYIVLAFA